MASDYEVHVLVRADGLDPENGNVDVEVTFDDGARYAATFFTVQNVISIMSRHRETGESAGGLYLWSDGMIVIRRLTKQDILEAIRDLHESNDLKSAFSKLDETNH